MQTQTPVCVGLIKHSQLGRLCVHLTIACGSMLDETIRMMKAAAFLLFFCYLSSLFLCFLSPPLFNICYAFPFCLTLLHLWSISYLESLPGSGQRSQPDPLKRKHELLQFLSVLLLFLFCLLSGSFRLQLFCWAAAPARRATKKAQQRADDAAACPLCPCWMSKACWE